MDDELGNGQTMGLEDMQQKMFDISSMTKDIESWMHLIAWLVGRRGADNDRMCHCRQNQMTYPVIAGKIKPT